MMHSLRKSFFLAVLSALFFAQSAWLDGSKMAERIFYNGKIAPGKQADLVLLDRDVMTVPAEELRDTKVLWTMVGGRVVWTANEAPGASTAARLAFPGFPSFAED